MNYLNLREWLEPLHMSAELRNADYKSTFNPRLSRQTARAYERVVQSYIVIRAAFGDSDPLRIKYRQAIAEHMTEFVSARYRLRSSEFEAWKALWTETCNQPT